MPALRCDDGMDGTTLRFLLDQNLSLKKKQEEQEKERKRLERRQVLLEEFLALADVPVRRRSPQQVSRLEALAEALDEDSAAPSSQPGSRKRKKRVNLLGLRGSSGGDSRLRARVCRLLLYSANSVLDCAFFLVVGVKVATFIWTCLSTRAG